MDTAKEEVNIQAKDEYKQKEYEGYAGYLEFEVLKDHREGVLYTKTSGRVLINLPKIKPILRALQDCHRKTLSEECEKFAYIHKNFLSDECMSEMAKKIHNDWSSLARKLGLSEDDITSCKSDSDGSNQEEAFMMLCKWRVSERVINSGLDVFNDLLRVLETAECERSERICQA